MQTNMIWKSGKGQALEIWKGLRTGNSERIRQVLRFSNSFLFFRRKSSALPRVPVLQSSAYVIGGGLTSEP